MKKVEEVFDSVDADLTGTVTIAPLFPMLELLIMLLTPVLLLERAAVLLLTLRVLEGLVRSRRLASARSAPVDDYLDS